MPYSFVLSTALVVLVPALPAQDRHEAALMVSAQVVSSCRIDVQDDGRVRVNCGARQLVSTRVSVNGHPQEPVATLAGASSNEQMFLLPATELVVASARHDLPVSDRHAGSSDNAIVLSIQ